MMFGFLRRLFPCSHPASALEAIHSDYRCRICMARVKIGESDLVVESYTFGVEPTKLVGKVTLKPGDTLHLKDGRGEANQIEYTKRGHITYRVRVDPSPEETP